ncbi:response regulator transcription factor [Brachybacterium phenoliresistens]|uniref:response regulator transcription factor n=1 Tax=Brachybacterium phenoliresistens TaxID=396014 RepID=UPI0031E1669F
MRIVLAEDSLLLREGVAQLLALEGHEIVAGTSNATELLHAVVRHAPDLAIVDVRMPPDFVDEGVHAALRIRRENPGTAVLLLSQVVERRYARELLDGSGGVGYLLKERVSDIRRFLDAIEEVASGGTAFDPEVIRQLLAAGSGPDPRLARLTDRERDVLAHLAQGLSNTSIAQRLYISRSGVEKHINTIFSKLAIPVGGDVNRRVLAVLLYLGAAPG